MVLLKEPRQAVSKPVVLSRPFGSPVDNLRGCEGIPGMTCQPVKSNDASTHYSQRWMRKEDSVWIETYSISGWPVIGFAEEWRVVMSSNS